MRAVLIEGGYILDLAAEAAVSARAADILVENGTVVKVAPSGTIEPAGAQRLDASGCLVLPGLTNAHTHSPENLAAGFCDGLQVDAWRDAVWARLDHLSDEEIRLAVSIGAAQSIRCGVTAIVDHFRQTPMSIEAVESACAAYESTGLRVMLAVMLRDRVGSRGNLIGAPTGGGPLPIGGVRDLWTAVAERHSSRSRVAMCLGPSSPVRCSDAMLEAAVELARRHALYLHTHVAETRAEADAAQEIYGCRMVRHLDDLGFLGSRTSLAHCVWVDDEEIGSIARSGAVAVHNPISNMALGTGIAPVRSMIDAGAPVALGTDGAASNGAQDIWETAKAAALLARCNTPEPEKWLTARQCLMLALDGGRRIFGLGPPAVVENSVADIAVFPVPERSLEEFFDPVRALVYGARSRARHVLVAGDPILVDGTIVSFDEPALMAELHRVRRSSTAWLS
jgi:cytosine/adenosine deaminase-related metal-dependent hydrolase